jgi:hypothetical protein
MAAAEVLIAAGCCFLGWCCIVEANLGKVDSPKFYKKNERKIMNGYYYQHTFTPHELNPWPSVHNQEKHIWVQVMGLKATATYLWRQQLELSLPAVSAAAANQNHLLVEVNNFTAVWICYKKTWNPIYSGREQGTNSLHLPESVIPLLIHVHEGTPSNVTNSVTQIDLGNDLHKYR